MSNIQKFKVNDRVNSIGHGFGTIISIDENNIKPINVVFDYLPNLTISYTKNGFIYLNESFSYDNISGI